MSSIEMTPPPINTEDLIVEVENRPAIWDTASKEYSDKNARKKAWEEILEKFGGELEEAAKKELGKELLKKWKNLRDSYFRELRRLKNVRSGSAAAKKTTYLFFQQLQFLKSVAETNITSSNIERVSETEPSTSQESLRYRPPCKKKAPQNDNNVGLEMVNVLRESIQCRELRESNTDQDKLFMLSLVDDFKRIPNHLKMAAKIEIIKLIQNFQSPNLFHAPHSVPNDALPNSQWSSNFSSQPVLHQNQRAYFSRSADSTLPTSGTGINQQFNSNQNYQDYASPQSNASVESQESQSSQVSDMHMFD